MARLKHEATSRFQIRSSLWNLPNLLGPVVVRLCGSEGVRPDKERAVSFTSSVMFGSLFKQAQDKSVAGKDREQEDHERPRSSADSHGRRPSEQQTQHPPTLRPSLERGVTTAVATPHDAVLAELFSHRRGPTPEAVLENPEVVSRRDEAETSHRPRSPSRTPLHDPFAGSLIGLSVPDDGDDAHNDRTHFETRKEDLWSHMTDIRDIQAQIANMHVAMENIGLGHQADQLTVERMHSTSASEGEKWEDADEGEDDEVKEKEVREQEFTKLANKFHGRKEATENIMTKVFVKFSIATLFVCSLSCR